MERLRVSKHPDYAIIQILRMGFVKSKTIKNPIAVHLPTVVTLDRISYEIVGTITHLGSPDAGHNRAYQKKGSSWYVFEDAKRPTIKEPIDNEKEQNYCILLKRCQERENHHEIKECKVLLEPLPAISKVTSALIKNQTNNLQESGNQDKGLKRTLSTDSMNSQGSSTNSTRTVTLCDGCGKSFSLLFSHLSRSAKCRQNYDMEKMKRQMEEEKREEKRRSAQMRQQ